MISWVFFCVLLLNFLWKMLNSQREMNTKSIILRFTNHSVEFYSSIVAIFSLSLSLSKLLMFMWICWVVCGRVLNFDKVVIFQHAMNLLVSKINMGSECWMFWDGALRNVGSSHFFLCLILHISKLGEFLTFAFASFCVSLSYEANGIVHRLYNSCFGVIKASMACI